MAKIVAKVGEKTRLIIGKALHFLFGVDACLLPAPTVEEQVANNEKVQSVMCEEDVITIVVPVAELEAYASSVPEQGTHKWIGLEIKTGLESIIGVKYDSYSLTEADAEEAAMTGCEVGSFVLYIKAEEVVEEPKEFVLAKEGYVDAKVKVIVEDSGN